MAAAESLTRRPSGPARADRRHLRARRRLEPLRAVMREQTAEQVGLAASGAAFWLVITVLPAAIAAVSVYGLVVSPQQVARNLSGLARGGPDSLGTTLATQLQKVAAGDHTGLTTGLVVSVVLALWSASAGFYNLERAIRAAYGLPPRDYLRARGRALLGALVVVVALGAVAFMSTSTSSLFASLPIAVVLPIEIPALVAVATAVIAALYRSSVGRQAVRRLIPGALGASLGLVVVVSGFALYLHYSTRYTAVYGALAGTVIGMIGTYLAVYVLLLGAVLNAQLDAPRGDNVPAANR
jgi:membrane protein